jgi:hypothetical protein
MREIVIDTETTGVDPLDGHRARLDLKVYLRRRIDAFINPLVLWDNQGTPSIMTMTAALADA